MPTDSTSGRRGAAPSGVTILAAARADDDLEQALGLRPAPLPRAACPTPLRRSMGRPVCHGAEVPVAEAALRQAAPRQPRAGAKAVPRALPDPGNRRARDRVGRRPLDALPPRGA